MMIANIKEILLRLGHLKSALVVAYPMEESSVMAGVLF
jgi:hypothetical protein